ncbi:MAG: phenylacetic acid degradation operon negative regulatory protein PaaX [Bacillota bacterium]
MQARSLLFDLWGDYIQHVGGEVWASTLVHYVAPFGVTEVALRQALSRMTRQGWLEARKVGGRTCYSLTPRGRRRIVEASRRVYHPEDRPWDGQWCILVYSIPEPMRSRRDDLRKELVWTGFAHLSPGTWISPNPLEEAARELIHRYGMEPYTTLFTARHQGPTTPRELVERCWDLAAIQASYDRFIGQWGPRLAAGVAAMSDAERFVEQIQLVHDYRKFLFVDPGLPGELLPDPWRGDAARQLFQEYYALLSPGAKRFMDRHFEPTR